MTNPLPQKNEMSVMNGSGDYKVRWNPKNKIETEMAEKTFFEMVNQKKCLAFKLHKNGRKGQQITEFDPNATGILLIPPMQGG
jgi:hypothetical protein